MQICALDILVREIVAVNHAWKQAQDLFEDGSPLTISLRELKGRLQVRLLRYYFPDVFLELDPEASGEPLYSLRLNRSVGNLKDAAHLPVRKAKEFLSQEEIKKFTS
jgi:hypothetical protein